MEKEGGHPDLEGLQLPIKLGFVMAPVASLNIFAWNGVRVGSQFGNTQGFTQRGATGAAGSERLDNPEGL